MLQVTFIAAFILRVRTELSTVVVIATTSLSLGWTITSSCHIRLGRRQLVSVEWDSKFVGKLPTANVQIKYR